MPRDTRRGRARVHAARSKGAEAGEAPRPAAAEGDRARAADGATRAREPGRDQGTGRARRGASRAPRRAATGRMERSEERWASVGAAKGMGTGTGRAQAPARQARARVTGSGTHGMDRGTEALGPGRDPRARARAPWAPGDREDGAWEPWGQGGAKGGGRGAGRPRSRTCSRCGASPPASNKCRRTTPTTTTTTTFTSTTSTLTPENSSPPNPHDPTTSQPPARRGRSRRGWPRRGGGARRGPGAAGTGAAGGAGARGTGAPALGPGLGYGPGPSEGSGPPPGGGGVRVVELGLLGDHQGDEEPALRCRAPPEGRGEPGSAPSGGGAAPEDHDRVLRAVIRLVWPDREPTWPAFLEGGGGAPHHGCGRQQLAPPVLAQRRHPLALSPAKPATAAAPTPTQAATQVTAQTAGAGEWQGDCAAGRPPRGSRSPGRTPPPRYSATEGRAPPRQGGRAGATSARGGPLPAAH